jgi:hypothetical protein
MMLNAALQAGTAASTGSTLLSKVSHAAESISIALVLGIVCLAVLSVASGFSLGNYVFGRDEEQEKIARVMTKASFGPNDYDQFFPDEEIRPPPYEIESAEDPVSSSSRTEERVTPLSQLLGRLFLRTFPVWEFDSTESDSPSFFEGSCTDFF